MNYSLVFDSTYIAPGMIIYNESFTQFLKIIPNINENNQGFTFIISDDVADNEREPFRKIEFVFDKESSLYPAVKQLAEQLPAPCQYSINPHEEGYNQIRIEDNQENVKIAFMKDLTHSKNLQCNAMALTIAGPSFMIFYQTLTTLVRKTDVKKVLEKMINLKTK